MTPVNAKNHFKKALLLITLVSAFYVFYDRVSIMQQSQWESATITSCEGKWVKVETSTNSTQYRDQLQFLPKATSDSGAVALGSIMLPSRSVCNLSVGSEVSILVHPNNADENRIYSFIQFWALPILFLSFPLLFLVGITRIALVRLFTVIFVLGFILLVTHELGLFKNLTNALSDKLVKSNIAVKKGSSKASLDRCIYTSMKKESVKRTEIKKLICMEEDITDVSSLSDLINLEELYLQDNALTSLENFPAFINLKKISVAGNKHLTSTKGIEKFTLLEELQANKSGLRDLNGLEQLSNLKVVGLMMNKLTKVSAFLHLEHIEKVVLSYNPIADISAFSNKTALTWFTAHDTNITDLTPLIGNVNLKVVGVSSPSFLCSQLEPLRATLPKTSKVFGPSHCNKTK
jgi:hypothetical protein